VHEIRTFGPQNAPQPLLHGKLSFMAPQLETMAPMVGTVEKKFHVNDWRCPGWVA